MQNTQRMTGFCHFNTRGDGCPRSFSDLGNTPVSRLYSYECCVVHLSELMSAATMSIAPKRFPSPPTSVPFFPNENHFFTSPSRFKVRSS